MGRLHDNDVVKVVTLQKAEDLLIALAPTSEYFPNRKPYSWLYRGLPCSDYKLVPSALRKDAQGKDALDRWQFGHHKSPIARELVLLETFFELADLRGLPLPEDSQQLRQSRAFLELEKLKAEYDLFDSPESSISPPKGEWPPMWMYSICGLAQHYGLPTRLLDWTYDYLVAAYFAARDVRNEHQEHDSKERKMAVWAFRKKPFYNALQVQAGFGRMKPLPYQLVTAPYSTNPNLAAQQGVFSVVPQPANEREPDRRPLDEIVGQHIPSEARRWLANNPVFFRFELPWSERKTLLSLLADSGTNGSTVFPGYRGVVHAVREKLSCWTSSTSSTSHQRRGS